MTQYKRLIEKLKDEIDAAGIQPEKRADILRDLGRELGLKAHLRPEAIAKVMALSDVPARTPEFYQDRTDKSETALAFVKRVYAPWIGKGFTVNILRRLDEPAYWAYRNYFRYRGLPENTFLPSLSDQIDLEYAALMGNADQDLPQNVLDEIQALRRIENLLVSRGKLKKQPRKRS